jgi:hypothetical protein
MLQWLLRWMGRATRSSPAPYRIPPQPPQPAHRLNAPGPVYVVDGCCLACGVWELDAPEHFAWADARSPQCYVSRQPENDEEFTKVARAMRRQELDCIRVRNCPDRWRAILERMGQGEFIDK